MPRRRGWPVPLVRRTLTALLAAAAISLAVPAAAGAKSFSVPLVFIDAQVNADGTMDVREKRTWSFDGDYTRVFWDLKTTGAQKTGEDVTITDVSVASETGPMPATSAPADARPAGFSRVGTQTPGVVRLPSDGIVTLSVNDLPASTFVEGRVLFPAGWPSRRS